jgi:uncharacterized delta-60 repeat protein
VERGNGSRKGHCGLVVILACVLTAMSASPALAASGHLDRRFGRDGKVITNFTAGFDGANGVAIQTNGKIVAVGGAGGSGGRFAIARYRTDGSLDRTFGGDGTVMTNFSPGTDVALDVAIQTDGRIVAAGGVSHATLDGMTVGEFALARYNTDGTLDMTFGGDGKVTTDFTVGWDGATGVAVQEDGHIVAAGFANSNCSCSKFALARYNADGSLDATFGGDGKVTTFFRFGGEANAVAIQADGKIVAAGRAGDPSDGRFALARYNLDGTLDTAFSGNGKLTTNMGQGETSATSVAIQANGKVVVAGFTDGPHEFGDTFGPGKFALARYRVDGTLDTRFSGDGKVKTRFGTRSASAEDVAIQADGKIVAAGTSAGAGGRFALARYKLNGTLDATFGGDGRVTTNFTAGEDLAFGVAIQANGKIVVAGHAWGGGGRFALARYLDL